MFKAISHVSYANEAIPECTTISSVNIFIQYKMKSIDNKFTGGKKFGISLFFSPNLNLFYSK